jgi:DNA invertase Pin-like site-specific DNA recombinase
MSKKFGYIRVSSSDQNIDRQHDKMLALGIDERDIFVDKQSGKDFERSSYQLLKRMVREDDTVVIDSITRLGRNMKDTQKEYHWFVEKKVNLEFIKEPMLNTDNASDDVMKKAINQIILTILTAFAEHERNEIKQRQAEGIAAAKSRGKHLGRPKAEYPSNFEMVYKNWKDGELKAVEAMEELNLTKSTFYKLVKQYEEK